MRKKDCSQVAWRGCPHSHCAVSVGPLTSRESSAGQQRATMSMMLQFCSLPTMSMLHRNRWGQAASSNSASASSSFQPVIISSSSVSSWQWKARHDVGSRAGGLERRSLHREEPAEGAVSLSCSHSVNECADIHSSRRSDRRESRPGRCWAMLRSSASLCAASTESYRSGSLRLEMGGGGAFAGEDAVPAANWTQKAAQKAENCAAERQQPSRCTV
jgi:hypothetical protein